MQWNTRYIHTHLVEVGIASFVDKEIREENNRWLGGGGMEDGTLLCNLYLLDEIKIHAYVRLSSHTEGI